MQEFVSIVVSGVLLGGSVEILAYAMKWWEFSVPGFIFLQIIVVEGGAMGTLSWAIKDTTPSSQYVLSACAGGLLETFNAAWFELWSFPGNSFLFIKGRIWIVLVMAFFWGFYCPLLNQMAPRLLRWWREKMA